MLLQMSSEKHTWNYIIDLFFEPFNDFIELKKKKKTLFRGGALANFKRIHGTKKFKNLCLNPPANAGDTGSIPGPGRSHML